jgi:ferredoxin-type protein NapH
MSPALSLQGAFEGIVSGSLLLFGLLFLSSPLLGRLWCGWLCPGGALQDLATPINSRKPGKHADTAKYVIWIIWFGLIVVFMMLSGRINGVQPLYMTERIVSVDDPFKFIIYYMVIAIFLVVALVVGRRGACHSICWMAPFMTCGMCIGGACHIPAIHIAYDKTRCISCGLCAKSCPMSLDPVKSAALPKVPFECINCGVCITSCRKYALKYKYGRRSGK